MKTFFTKNIRLLIAFVLIMFGVYIFYRQVSVHSQVEGQLRIAIFEPATHPAIDEIVQGFIHEMNQSGKKYSYTRYNANANKVLLYAQAQEIMQRSYDLVFTIGLGCSVAMKELSLKQASTMPIVFCAIDDHLKFDLQGTNITGVIDATNYQRQLDIAVQLVPSIKNILLVYDRSQGSGLEKDVDSIQSVLDEKNIGLKVVEINGLTEIQQKTTMFMDHVDLVMILKDHTAVSGIDTLIKLCQKYQVPLLASDLNSGAKGAALAYGIYEADSGRQGALQAQLILEQGRQPAQIPVIAVDGMVMNINRKEAEKQGLNIDFHLISIADVELQ